MKRSVKNFAAPVIDIEVCIFKKAINVLQWKVRSTPIKTLDPVQEQFD